jgi:UDP-glucose 4-epimerase
LAKRRRTFLVTGGCGFIGSHLCEALLARGDAVQVLDDLSSGKLENLPEEARLVHGDVCDSACVHEALEGADGCFHLAAIASVEHGVRDWLGTHRVNLTGTITLFEAIRRRTGLGSIPVVYASSAAVYGNCKTLPITEDAEKQPLSAYGADKYACELHAKVATHVHGIPTTGLRFFNVYGPRQDPASPYSGVISIFCDRLRRDEVLLVHGDGRQTRDFIFVSDVVSAMLRAMELNLAGARSFNCCTGIATSVLDLARLIAELCGRDLNLCFAAPRSGEIRHSLGSPLGSRVAFDLPEAMTLRAGLAKLLIRTDRTSAPDEPVRARDRSSD